MEGWNRYVQALGEFWDILDPLNLNFPLQRSFKLQKRFVQVSLSKSP